MHHDQLSEAKSGHGLLHQRCSCSTRAKSRCVTVKGVMGVYSSSCEMVACVISESHSCSKLARMAHADDLQVSPPGPATQSSCRRSNSADFFSGAKSIVENASCRSEATPTERSCTGAVGGSVTPSGGSAHPKKGVFCAGGGSGGSCGMFGTFTARKSMTSSPDSTGNFPARPWTPSARAGSGPSSVARGATMIFGYPAAWAHSQTTFSSRRSQSTARTSTNCLPVAGSFACCRCWTALTNSGAKCWQCGHQGAKNSSIT
mmetsp:Transcript_86088/g.221690  ORF Transcript_86088/g.221690 Transcript_86088/m.221690 type:complete len:260 (-) Transcript_86088:321-1100(-)